MPQPIGAEYTRPFRVKDIEQAKQDLAFDGVSVHVVKDDGEDKILLVADDVCMPIELEREGDPVEGDLTDYISSSIPDTEIVLMYAASVQGDRSVRAGVTAIGPHNFVKTETLTDVAARLEEDLGMQIASNWYARLLATMTPKQIADKANSMTVEQFAAWANSQ